MRFIINSAMLGYKTIEVDGKVTGGYQTPLVTALHRFSGQTSNKHFMLMGDLNYPFDAVSGHAKEFCNCLEDNFLIQNITIPTRKQHIGLSHH